MVCCNLLFLLYVLVEVANLNVVKGFAVYRYAVSVQVLQMSQDAENQGRTWTVESDRPELMTPALPHVSVAFVPQPPLPALVPHSKEARTVVSLCELVVAIKWGSVCKTLKYE